MNPGKNIEEAISSAGGAIGAVVVGKVYEYLYDKVFSDELPAYSDEEVGRHQELEGLYKLHLKLSAAPDYWILKNKRPSASFVLHRDYESYLLKAKEKRLGVKHYNYYSSTILDIIVSYLEQRKNRVLGQGNPGDLVELFFLEWMVWALNELPLLKYDDPSIEQLEARLIYIREVKKHANIFKQGNLSSDLEKFDIIPIIEKQLNACKQKAEEEKSRITSQQHFNDVQRDMGGLLFEGLKVIYYARSSRAFSLPFLIDDYTTISPDPQSAKLVKKLFPSIKKTHTGAMLHATLMFGDIDSFDLQMEEKGSVKKTFSKYFKDDFTAKKNVDWKSQESDLPPWVDKDEQYAQLIVIQKLCENIFRFSAIKKQIEAAYSLSGLAGDLWAYGDKQGKNSVAGLLCLLDSELERLTKSFKDFYIYHENLQDKYNKINKKDQDTTENRNFRKVKKSLDKLLELSKLLKSTSNAIATQLKEFPEDAEKKTEQKKHELYRNVHLLLRKFCPEKAFLFTYDNVDSVNFSNTPLTLFEKRQASINRKIELLLNSINDFTFNLSVTTKGYIKNKDQKFDKYFQNKSTSKEREAFKRPWSLSDSYTNWTKGFFTRNRDTFKVYKTLLKAKLKKAIIAKDLVGIDVASYSIQELLNNLIKQLKEDRPKWRFKYLIIPASLGYPFNQKANRFAKLMINDLTKKNNELLKTIQKAQKLINQVNAKPRKDTEKLDIAGINKEMERTRNNLNLFNSRKEKQSVSPLEEKTQEDSPIVVIDQVSDADSNIPANPFHKWYNQLDTMLDDWLTKDFSYDLNIISSQETAQTILAECMSYRSSLNGKDKVFLESCGIIEASIKRIIDSNDAIQTKSKMQLGLILQILKTLISPPGTQEYVTNEQQFDLICKNIFIEKDSSYAKHYNLHGLLGNNNREEKEVGPEVKGSTPVIPISQNRVS